MPAEQNLSLRILLLRRLLPATLTLLMAGALFGYWVALGSATKAYDRGLLDIAFSISEQLQYVDGHVQLALSPQARSVLLTDKFDRIFYSVQTVDGYSLDGNQDLPQPSKKSSQGFRTTGRAYYDAMLGREPIRVAALQSEVGGQPVIILAAETRRKRNELVRDILLGVLVPELLLVVVSISVIWFGVRSGLRPLKELRSELAGRSQTDLSPVAVEIPEEIQPVVKEINALLKRLDHSLASQRNFVADAAHQLRTPIAALQAQVEACVAESGPHMRNQLAGLLAATRRMSHLVSQLLVLARTEPGLGVNQPAVDLMEITSRLADTWLPVAIEKQIDLGFELEPAPLRGNLVLLEELVGNLIDNALRHTPAGGVVTVACGRINERKVFISVNDSGQGIPPEECERIFERFYRSSTSSGEGCGLGLAIVAQIAHQHGGSVSARRSLKLGGAQFQVTLAGVAPT